MRILLSFLTILTFAITFGQAVPGHSIPMGLVAEMPYVRDEFMSPLNYTGPGGGVYLGYQYRNSKHFINTTLGVNGDYLFPSGLKGHPSRIYGLRMKFNTQWNRRILSKPNTFEWLTGVGWKNKMDVRYLSRFSNSSTTFDAWSSITWSNVVQRQFHFWNRHWDLNWNSDLMLFSAGARPAFSTPFEGTLPIALYAWNNTFSFDSAVQLSLLLTNGNAITLGYSWEALYLSDAQKLYKGVHQIFLGTQFRLSR